MVFIVENLSRVNFHRVQPQELIVWDLHVLGHQDAELLRFRSQVGVGDHLARLHRVQGVLEVHLGALLGHAQQVVEVEHRPLGGYHLDEGKRRVQLQGELEAHLGVHLGVHLDEGQRGGEAEHPPVGHHLGEERWVHWQEEAHEEPPGAGHLLDRAQWVQEELEA